MDFSGRIFLAALEEDNEQKSLFRVKLLVDESGLVDQEEQDLAGDEGFLRIVPDRQEQYTFKERLRLLGPICLVDLKHISPDLMKVRPNKNYAPGRGEVNQYVLYSDTVHAIHSQPVYEVVSNPLLTEPLTRGYYMRKGGNIQGPYDRETGDLLDGLSCIAPDSDKLFAVELSDGREHMFFWPRVVPGQAPLQRRPEAAVPPPAYEEIGWSSTLLRPALEERQQPVEAAALEAPEDAQLEAPISIVWEAAAGIAQALTQAGFVCSQDDAVAMLVCLTVFPWVRLTARHRCDALLAAGVLSDALGARSVSLAGSNQRTGDGGYRFAVVPAAVAAPEDKGQAQLLLRCEHSMAEYFPGEAEDAPAWPLIQLNMTGGFGLSAAQHPNKKHSVEQMGLALEERAEDLPKTAMARLSQKETDLAAKGQMMPLMLRRDLLRFLRRVHPHLEGGANSALMYAERYLTQPFLARGEALQDAPW